MAHSGQGQAVRRKPTLNRLLSGGISLLLKHKCVLYRTEWDSDIMIHIKNKPLGRQPILQGKRGIAPVSTVTLCRSLSGLAEFVSLLILECFRPKPDVPNTRKCGEFGNASKRGRIQWGATHKMRRASWLLSKGPPTLGVNAQW